MIEKMIRPFLFNVPSLSKDKAFAKVEPCLKETKVFPISKPIKANKTNKATMYMTASAVFLIVEKRIIELTTKNIVNPANKNKDINKLIR